VCKHRDGWRAFRTRLGTRRMEAYDAKLLPIGLALLESAKKMDTLQTHRICTVAVFSGSQSAIRRTENLVPVPGQHQVR
jgi:hypothetical protein